MYGTAGEQGGSGEEVVTSDPGVGHIYWRSHPTHLHERLAVSSAACLLHLEFQVPPPTCIAPPSQTHNHPGDRHQSALAGVDVGASSMFV